MFEESSLATYLNMNFSWDKRPYKECCTRKERSVTVQLLAGVQKLKGIIKNSDHGRCPLCLGDEDQTYIADLFRNYNMESGIFKQKMADGEGICSS